MMKRLGLLLIPTFAAAACAANTSGDPTSAESAPVAAAPGAPAPGGPGPGPALPPITKVTQTANPYTLFETLQVRPLALSGDGKTLYALNTPDNRVEIFHVTGTSLQSAGSVEVGLEPVALALRNDGELWVVNHLSDSVSVVTLDPMGARVTRTLLVGDEPRDIVFGGPTKNLAFITTAHRGQSSPDDPDLFTPGVGRADVWVFDGTNLGTAPGGTRLTKITLFADTPRALAVTPDGSTVYAAAFFSGNQTTAVSEDAVNRVYGGQMPGPAYIQIPTPSGPQIMPQPSTGLIVKYTNGHWLDAYGSNFDAAVTITLPDQDVFAIDATQKVPVAKANGAYAHVGTTLFNMAVNPKSGKVYVSNTDAHNDVRFEGHAPGFTSVAGDLVDSRISIIDPARGTVTADNLNPHLTHAVPPAVVGSGDPTLSRAFPQDLTFSADGSSVYVVAQGSAKLAIYSTAALEAGSATPTQQNQVNLSAGGPSGVVTDGKLAFVLTRFDDGISVVDLTKNAEVAHTTMYSPEPATVTAGRQYLYDATHTSALGDQACASCHIGGDFDGLAWDLGDPGSLPLTQTELAANESVIHTVPEAAVAQLIGAQSAGYIFGYYQPVKGPMTTQSLRGLDNHGAMHWRGDRNGAVQQTGAPFLDGMGNPVVSAQPNSGIFDEFNAFKSFNVAFPGLVGDGAPISDADMSDFATFALQITYPPNPIRNLDHSLTLAQAAGQQFFFNSAPGVPELPVDRFHNCNGCHVLDRNGNAGQTAHPGFFGTDGRLSFENETQTFKVPHLRNAYQKIGMFGTSPDSTHAISSLIPQLNPPVVATRGFGFQHDGVDGKLEDFFTAFVFVETNVPVSFAGIQNIPPNPYGIPLFNGDTGTDPLDPTTGVSAAGVTLRQQIASYVFAFDTNLYPVVGQETTLTPTDASAVASRIALFESQAAAGSTDLVARTNVKGVDTGFVWTSGGWQSAVSSLPLVTDAQLQALAQTSPVTFTCVPPGEGYRVGIDRDGDGYADGDELLAGTNPANPNSYPGHP